MRLTPISVQDARVLVGRLHRHNLPPKSGLFAVAVTSSDEVVGVAIAGRPVARALQDGYTVEVVRVATDGTPNACSMLYGAITRAAKALGYTRAITYTLESEPGTSLRASGWTEDGTPRQRSDTWHGPSRTRQQTDLFGDRRPLEAKQRWIRHLGPNVP